MILSSMPVSAKSCSYEYDQQAIGYGNINKDEIAYTYSQYVLGSNAAAASGLAKYSVGKGGSLTNVKAITNMTTTGQVTEGVSKIAGKTETVTICLYKNRTLVASVSDS